MPLDNRLIAYVALALLTALVVSFLMTPVVKTFAYKVGAVDVPKDARRMHKVPIPRLGGLAIFIGFMVSVLILGGVLIPALNGVVIQAFSNPNIFSDSLYWVLGPLSVPFTVLWIVAITNAVNLIDGLDGLANGVSAISATTMLVIALLASSPTTSTPPRCSWGTPGPPSWAISWPPCPSRDSSSSTR